jgi:SNF2 family DNA or RNA helicase
MEAKPNFNESSRPPESGPFVLDEAEGIQVPAPVNRYLRPYQQEGVQFLWEKYKADGGGILGDDMVS